MTVPASLRYDFTPVQDIKAILVRVAGEHFDRFRNRTDGKPPILVFSGAVLRHDKRGDVDLTVHALLDGASEEQKILINKHNEDAQRHRKIYGDLPPGRYRAKPPGTDSFSASLAPSVRFWPNRLAPYLMADIFCHQIDTFSKLLEEEILQQQQPGHDAIRESAACENMVRALGATEDEWRIVSEFIELINDLSAELQVGCRQGNIEACDRVVEFETQPSVISASAIAYMRSIGACNLPVSVLPKKQNGKYDWTSKEARLALWNNWLESDKNQTKFAAKWGLSRRGTMQRVSQVVGEFGQAPRTLYPTGFACFDESKSGPQRIKGSRY